MNIARPKVLLLCTAAALMAAAPAGAVDGPLYEVGWQGAAVTKASSWWSNIFGNEFDVGAAAGTATVGPKWWINWTGCPQPGMAAHSVRWSASRSSTATSARLAFVVQGGIHSNLVNLPVRPSYAHYAAAVGGGCGAELRVDQIGGGTEPVRQYWIANPRAVFQDVQAPGVGIAAPAAGTWIRAGQTSLDVSWNVSDNMGSDGVGQQRVFVADQLKWSGYPGAGNGHAIAADLVNVPDGRHTVRVEVDGDGTGGASQAVPVNIDRTPPVAYELGHGYSGAPGAAGFAWTAVDPGGFGVASSAVQVNAATNGSATGAWVTAVTRTGGGALSAIDVPLSSLVANGLHAWRVVTLDVAGNSHVVPAPGTVVVDSVAPSVDLDPAPAAYVSRMQAGFVAGDNLQATLGLGTAEIAVNTATDGGASGTWQDAEAQPTAATPGRNARDVTLAGLPDGQHLLRLRVRNGAPFHTTLVTDRSMVVNVDTTSPVFPEPPTFTTPAPGSLRVSFVAHDPLAGVAGAALEWRDGTAWRPIARRPVANGAADLAGDTSQLPEGATTFRLAVTDGAGNVATASSSLGVDRTAPSVRGLALAGGPPWTLSWTQTDGPGGFGSCPTRVRVSGPGTDYAWKEVVSRRLGEGPHGVVLPLEGLTAGAYRVGVVACDAAGNTASAETAGLVLSAADVAALLAGARSGAGHPPADILDARLSLSMDRARVTRRAGRTVLVRRISFGTRIAVRGALRHATRLTGIADAEIEVRTSQGRVIGRGRTHRTGRFSVPVRPDASGLLRVGVPAGGRLLPDRGDADLRVQVVPRVTLTASSRHAVALGAPLVLSGRVTPAPRRAGAARKAIVLEWHDPVRGTWRPVVNHRTGAGGRFRLSWRFQTPGLRTRLRVRVPAERGWPLEGGVSRSLAVDVR